MGNLKYHKVKAWELIKERGSAAFDSICKKYKGLSDLKHQQRRPFVLFSTSKLLKNTQ